MEPYTRIDIIGEDEVSTTVTSLLPHREYSVYVAAFNLYGDGEASQIKNFITPGMPPSEPRVSGITFLNKKPFYKPYKARITWRKPEETYEMPVKRYIMLYKSDIDAQYHKREVNGSADEMSLEVDDLCKDLKLLGREYEFKIAAVTDEGIGNNATERLSTPEGKPVQGPLNLRYEVNNRQYALWDEWIKRKLKNVFSDEEAL
uniref:Fibronectin type-III domain-containing protein n=1 Tax=Syphacia muris TaxID=451379 RepID=A0A0N5AMS3_9BILA